MIERCAKGNAYDVTTATGGERQGLITVRALMIGVVAVTTGALAAVVAGFMAAAKIPPSFGADSTLIVGLAAAAVAWISVAVATAVSLNQIIR